VRRRLVTAVAALFLACATPLTGVAAHTHSPAHYNAGCNTGNTGYNAQAYVFRPPSGAGNYKSIGGSIIVQDIFPCTGGTATNIGQSYVNVVSGARWVGSSETQELQFGFAEFSCVNGTSCPTGFSNGVTDWWYTAHDGTPFGEAFAADWVDINHDGHHDATDLPVIGDTYELTITYMTTPCTCWRFRIFNDVGQTDWHDITRNSGTNGWLTNLRWGFEIWNDANAFGRKQTSSNFTMWPLHYMNYNGSIWTTLTGDVMPCHWEMSDVWPGPDNHWGSEHCDVTTPNGETHLDGWQANHT
jgi:hypothetical protein